MMNITRHIPRQSQIRKFSSQIDLKKNLNSNKPPNPQPFVKIRLRPGESDPLSKIKRKPRDPIYRPRWNNKAQIISAEDFNARPKVSFNEQFDSMHDAMVVLSWLDEGKRQDVYQSYLHLMVEQEKEFKTTSHEYIMRVIGEKFNLTAVRVAAIVQNCHDEEQAAKDGRTVNEKMAKYVDTKIKEHIDNAYMAYGEVNPNEFVETPTGVAGIGSSSGEVVRVEDLYDLDDLIKKAVTREKGEAQLLIDEKVYIEDVDDGTVDSNVNNECLKLVEKAKDFDVLKKDLARNVDDKVEFSLPDNGSIEDEDGNKTDTERRQRWKYVAQTINVREQKKLGNKSRRGAKLKKKQKKDNTLVEEDGETRVASIAEVSQTAWKPERDESEFIYKGVKTAWLNRQLKGEKYGWGRVPDSMKVKQEVAEEPDSSAKADAADAETDSTKSVTDDTNKDEK